MIHLPDSLTCISQNFCSYSNFDAVWRQTRKGRKKMAVKWLEQLQVHHPDLGRRALQLNAEDGFVMYNKETAAAEKVLKQQQKDAEKEKKRASAQTESVSSSSGPQTVRDSSNSHSAVNASVKSVKDKSKKRKKDHSSDSVSSDLSEGRTTNDGESSSGNSAADANDSHSSDHRSKRRKSCMV